MNETGYVHLFGIDGVGQTDEEADSDFSADGCRLALGDANGVGFAGDDITCIKNQGQQ